MAGRGRVYTHTASAVLAIWTSVHCKIHAGSLTAAAMSCLEAECLSLKRFC